MSADGMNVGFLPRVLPTTPTGRLSLGRRGPSRPQADQQPTPANAVSAVEDATLAAGPRKRRRGASLNVDLRPADATPNAIVAFWASILAIAASLRTRLNGVGLPSFSRSTASAARLDGAAAAPATDGAASADAPANRSALANLRISLLQATDAVRTRVGSGPLARLELPAALAPVARLDRKVLATLGVLSVAAIYGLTVAEPPATQQVAAAERAPLAAAKPATPPTDPALANPFSQKSINTELRALRKAQQPGDQARSLTVLNDGTMGMNIVNNGAAANVMVRGQDIAIEPLAGDPESGATLDIRRVHGTAITRFLDEAATTHQLPRNQLGSLRLIENEAKPGTFIWIGVWNDPNRTTLYADREAQTVGESRPR